MRRSTMSGMSMGTLLDGKIVICYDFTGGAGEDLYTCTRLADEV